jgi:hypothetical protein
MFGKLLDPGRLRSILLCSIALAATAGCGGGGTGGGTSGPSGSIKVSLKWPTQNANTAAKRLVPSGTQTVLLTLYSGTSKAGKVEGLVAINPPSGGSVTVSNYVFPGLVGGDYFLVADAYNQSFSTATAQQDKGAPPGDIATAEGVELTGVTNNFQTPVGVTMISEIDHFYVTGLDALKASVNGVAVPSGGGLELSSLGAWTVVNSSQVAVSGGTGTTLVMSESGQAPDVSVTPEDNSNAMLLLSGTTLSQTVGAGLTFTSTANLGSLTGTVDVTSGQTATSFSFIYNDSASPDGNIGSTTTQTFSGGVQLVNDGPSDTVQVSASNLPTLDASGLAVIENIPTIATGSSSEPNLPGGVGYTYQTPVVPIGSTVSIPGILDRTQYFTYAYTGYLRTSGGGYAPILQTPSSVGANYADNPFKLSGNSNATQLAGSGGTFTLPINLTANPIPAVDQLISGYTLSDSSGLNSYTIDRQLTLSVPNLSVQVNDPVTGDPSTVLIPVTDFTLDGPCQANGTLYSNSDLQTTSGTGSTWTFYTDNPAANDTNATSNVDAYFKFHYNLNGVAEANSTWTYQNGYSGVPAGYGIVHVVILPLGSVNGGGVRGIGK